MSMSFESFRQTALAQGYAEVLERHWQPHQVVLEHKLKTLSTASPQPHCPT
ncbi:hypothetical protein J7U46_07560 [Pelomonas sp. V22]|uniref:hypothetical protein n=1 Tax=Pelomonas sp. V22 TaxID=2822139 RepID=UPI0024A9015B|nr:hypothetical protein [Pelomonas sp. V22]MDI4632902.1 hypothetical protein [Pelomonas sp. V22]